MVLAFALMLWLGAPAPFTLVNGTDAQLSAIAARPVGETGSAKTLGPGRLSPGARGAVGAQVGDGCAFDIEAEAGGTTLRWSDVNLCDVQTVTLRRRGATLWVDYD